MKKKKMFEKEAEEIYGTPFSKNDKDVISIKNEYISLRNLGYSKKRAMEKIS